MVVSSQHITAITVLMHTKKFVEMMTVSLKCCKNLCILYYKMRTDTLTPEKSNYECFLATSNIQLYYT